MTASSQAMPEFPLAGPRRRRCDIAPDAIYNVLFTHGHTHPRHDRLFAGHASQRQFTVARAREERGWRDAAGEGGALRRGLLEVGPRRRPHQQRRRRRHPYRHRLLHCL